MISRQQRARRQARLVAAPRSTSATRSGCCNWRAERLTFIVTRLIRTCRLPALRPGGRPSREHPAADRARSGRVSSAIGMNVRRARPCPGPDAPADQRLHAADVARRRARRSAGSRAPELVAVDGGAQVASRAPAASTSAVVHARRRSSVEAALALRLGRVHRRVGVAQQLLGAWCPAAVGERDADARLREHLAGRRAGTGRAARRAAARRSRAASVVVARPRAGSRTRRRRAGRRCRPAACSSQQPAPTAASSSSPALVAEAVVDRLEVVEVEEQHRESGSPRGGAGRGRARARSANSARLARPVSGVVERLVGELLLECLALGDVAGVEHQPWTSSSSSRLVAVASTGSQRPSRRRIRHSTVGSTERSARTPAIAAATSDVSSGWISSSGLVPSRFVGRVSEHLFDRRRLVAGPGPGRRP